MPRLSRQLIKRCSLTQLRESLYRSRIVLLLMTRNSGFEDLGATGFNVHDVGKVHAKSICWPSGNRGIEPRQLDADQARAFVGPVFISSANKPKASHLLNNVSLGRSLPPPVPRRQPSPGNDRARPLRLKSCRPSV